MSVLIRRRKKTGKEGLPIAGSGPAGMAAAQLIRRAAALRNLRAREPSRVACCAGGPDFKMTLYRPPLFRADGGQA